MPPRARRAPGRGPAAPPPLPTPPALPCTRPFAQDASNNAGLSLNYTYYFNFGVPIDPTKVLPGRAYGVNPTGSLDKSLWDVPAGPPTQDYGWCDITFPGQDVVGPKKNTFPLRGPSPAFQFANPWPWRPYDVCHRLGAPVPAGGAISMAWSLYDTSNPSRGVAVTYLTGDLCPNTVGTPRQLTVWLLCYDDATNVPDEEVVLETNMCNYEIFVKSAFGCPVQCPLTAAGGGSTRRICAGHGVCDYDSVRGNSRCFCNPGYYGEDCSDVTVPTPRLTSTGTILIVVSVVLGLTLAFLGYIWFFKIARLRLDPTAYSTLQAGPDDDGGAKGATAPTGIN